MSKENDAKAKAKELNQMVGYNRFSVIATPSPVHQGNAVANSYSIHDSMTGENYVFGSIYGTGALVSLTNQLKKERSDVSSSASLKAKKAIRHDVFDEYDDENPDEVLEHYGVLGMKWGVRKDPQRAYERANKKLTALDKRATKAGAKAARKETRSLRRQQRADTAWLFPKTKAKLADWAIGRSNKARAKYAKKMSRAVSWYKQMENAFRDTKISDLNPSYTALGEKYSKIQVNDLMGNAQTTLANKQLRMIYRRMGRGGPWY